MMAWLLRSLTCTCLYHPHCMMRTIPVPSFRSFLLICIFKAALACRASMQMTGRPSSFSSLQSHVAVAPVSSPPGPPRTFYVVSCWQVAASGRTRAGRYAGTGKCSPASQKREPTTAKTRRNSEGKPRRVTQCLDLRREGWIGACSYQQSLKESLDPSAIILPEVCHSGSGARLGLSEIAKRAGS